MTYEELTSRLNRVETALTALKTGSYQTMDFNVEATVQQLESLQTTLQEQIKVLAESEKTDSHVITRDPNSRKEVLKQAQKQGVSSPEFREKVNKADIGDTFNLEEDSVEEDHHNNPTDDSDMAKIQLLQVAEYSRDLLNMIEDGQELDAWIQAKITKISDYIGTVKHYLEGEDYLAGEHDEDHPAHGDEEFYEEIPTEYKEMYESWVKSLFKKEPSVIGKIINYQGNHYKILDIDNAGSVEVIDAHDEKAEPFYLNRAQLKQGVIDDTQEDDTEEMELDIHPEDE